MDREQLAWIWIVFAVVVVLFEIWYAAAFVAAYLQLRERLMLLPVLQALLMLAAFAYIGVVTVNGTPLNGVLVLGLLVGAMAVSFIWRRSANGLPLLLRSYPRGTLDVLAFRKPAVDLKRRVRTK